MEQQRRRFQQTLSRQELLVLFAAARQKASHLDKSKSKRGGFMRSIHAAAFALCLLTVAPVRSLAGDPQHDVQAAYTAFDATYNKGDAKAVVALYVPNAKVLPPTHEVASGPAAIEKFFAGFYANGVTDHKLELIDAGGDDKVVYGTANWSAKGKDKDGKPANFSGIATHVFERQADGSLKLRLHTFN
ncbi:nuclear transport factor 2 family protein [Bradyrhizobium sp. 145]|uniref:YybH family protein n=1 Tax=Bradyrhizobium sp. 145 TaxID=2782621 RepID=UPI001FF8D732|nr:nuclear transport factor 2 family protein [Bradyrhizobium sp. 145]